MDEKMCIFEEYEAFHPIMVYNFEKLWFITLLPS